MSIQYLDSYHFDEVIYDNAEASLVIFSRESCSVCKGMAQSLESLKYKYIDKYNFYYVDAEKQHNLFKRFSLQGVPQILFFKEGEYKGKLAGHVQEEQVEEKIAEIFEGMK